MRVLVIDDEAGLRKTIRLMLESVGHEVAEAEDGRAGLDLFRAWPADVVITDLIMPRKEGIETIRDIRALDAKVRIVAISGGGRTPGADFLQMAGKLGADAMLAKPFRKDELIAAVGGRGRQSGMKAG